MLLWPLGDSKYVLRHLRPSSLGPQNVAVVPAILKMRKYAISLRPLLSSKSFKNDSNYKHSWSAWFLSWSISIDFSSNNTSNYKHSRSVWFCLCLIIFYVLYIPIGKSHTLLRYDLFTRHNFRFNFSFEETHNGIFTFWGRSNSQVCI